MLVERLLECEDENSLHLRGLGEFSLQALFALLPFKRSVTALKLSLLRKAPLRVCCEKLSDNVTLTRIDLSGNKVLPRGCAWLAAALDTNETLTSIALNDSGLCRKGNYAGLRALSRRLRKRSSKVRQLELARNGLKATGVKVVAELVLHSRALQVRTESPPVYATSCLSPAHLAPPPPSSSLPPCSSFRYSTCHSTKW
jgi:hypothetical protein